MTDRFEAIVDAHGTPAFVYDLAAVRERVGADGTPAFVYDLAAGRERVGAVRAAFGGMAGVRYAAKANPHPAVLRTMAGVADGLDVSSGAELARGLAAGFAPARIGFTGPVKTGAELGAAVRAGIGAVVLESVEEAAALDGAARAAGRAPVPVLLRLSPDRLPAGFAVRMAGRPTRFGIDEGDLGAALAALRPLEGLSLAGFHAFPGTQCLDAEPLAESWLSVLDLFRRAAEAAGIEPAHLVLGGGFGIPYHDGDEPLDLAAVAERVGPALAALAGDARLGRARLEIETGRHLVGEAGVYLVRVERVKRSRGRDIAILDGGMHHHLAAAGHLGSVIPRNYPIRRVRPAAPGEEAREVDLAGPLCTSIDSLGHSVRLPPLAAGDLLAIGSSGAYGPTASPLFFLSRALPKELVVEANGTVADVSAESTFRSPPPAP